MAVEGEESKGVQEEEEGGGGEGGDLVDLFPRARVRKIMRIDPEINKMTSEALALVSLSTALFLRHLAEASVVVALHRKKKVVRTEHLRDAVRNHRPTSDFLHDCLPQPAAPTATERPKERPRQAEKPVPAGTRRIDNFFRPN